MEGNEQELLVPSQHNEKLNDLNSKEYDFHGDNEDEFVFAQESSFLCYGIGWGQTISFDICVLTNMHQNLNLLLNTVCINLHTLYTF